VQLGQVWGVPRVCPCCIHRAQAEVCRSLRGLLGAPITLADFPTTWVHLGAAWARLGRARGVPCCTHRAQAEVCRSLRGLLGAPITLADFPTTWVHLGAAWACLGRARVCPAAPTVPRQKFARVIGRSNNPRGLSHHLGALGCSLGTSGARPGVPRCTHRAQAEVCEGYWALQ